MVPLPSVFLSHGSPMHALQAGEAGLAWAALGKRLGKPRAIVIASAHWETNVPMVTGAERPETVHDFSGFPEPLYRLRYTAPGAPAIAQKAAQLLKQAGFTAAIDGCRGLDHGAWAPLLYMYPDADVPVVQLSLQPALGTRHHIALGRALRRLEEDNVLVIGSGHMTHNLRDWMRGQGAPAPTPRNSPNGCASASKLTTSIPSPTTARARRTACARIRPTSISCRCSWRSARRATATSPSAS